MPLGADGPWERLDCAGLVHGAVAAPLSPSAPLGRCRAGLAPGAACAGAGQRARPGGGEVTCGARRSRKSADTACGGGLCVPAVRCVINEPRGRE